MAGKRNKGAVRLKVRVKPRASANTHRVLDDGSVEVRLTAAPLEGKANDALVAYLSKRLGIPKASVHVVGGAKSRNKLVELAGVSVAQVFESLR